MALFCEKLHHSCAKVTLGKVEEKGGVLEGMRALSAQPELVYTVIVIISPL